jgi:hypothetical protein
MPDKTRGMWENRKREEGIRDKRMECSFLHVKSFISHVVFKSILYSMDKIRQTFKHYYD